MRVFAIAACVAFFLNTGAAFAADCTKGMLWPYVRNPGDCLTDEEIRTGKLGASNGPINTAPDVSAIRAGTPNGGGDISTASLPSSGGSGRVAAPDLSDGYLGGGRACTKGWLWPFARDPGDCLTDTEKKNGLTGVYGGGAAPVAQASYAAPSAVSTAPGGTAVVASVPASTGACTKGWLWPFVRDSGDCLTDTEKKEGLSGTYGGGPAPVSQASVAPVSAAPAISAAPGGTAPSGTATLANVPATGACSKGWLWPFVRDSGDCLTATEKQEGHAGVYGNPDATPVAAAPAVATASAPSPAPAVYREGACNKGWFWPFVRSDGDCLTATEKQEGHSGVYGNPAVMPVSQTVAAPAAQAPVAQAPAPAQAPMMTMADMTANGGQACHKGIFWPFSRSAGDCLTETEKKEGHTGVYGSGQ